MATKAKLSFKLGDTVTLNSGGPTMSVRAVNTTPPGFITYDCQWFAGKKLDTGRFTPEQLIAVAPLAPTPSTATP